MAALLCDVTDLLAESSCLLCFSERELLAAKALLQEQLFADGASATPRTASELAEASVAWKNLSESQQLAIQVRQLCNDAVDAGARTECDGNTLASEIACFCGLSKSQLQSISSMLECELRQT